MTSHSPTGFWLSYCTSKASLHIYQKYICSSPETLPRKPGE